MPAVLNSNELLVYLGLCKKMNVLLLDAMNLVHRARSGFAKGDHAIVFSFFRSLKPIIEKMKPDIVYFVLEGKPKHRKELSSDYKSNRKSQPSSFWRQCDEILEVLSLLPITVIKHPDYECDDVIANLAKKYSLQKDNVTIISTDSDFIQLWDTLDYEKVRLYNPVKKIYVEKPEYDYLEWKSFKGDVSDNISGVPGVGEKTAIKIMKNQQLKEEILSNDMKRKIFERNRELIRFHWFDNLDDNLSKSGCITSDQDVDLVSVKKKFELFDFKSMLTDKYWNKFESVFNKLSHTNYIKQEM